MITNVNTAEDLSRNEWKLIETEIRREPERMTLADHIKQKAIGILLIVGSVIAAKLTQDLTARILMFPLGVMLILTKDRAIL
jgi:hypothetical protein